MMITLRRSAERRHVRYRGNETWYTFYAPDETGAFADHFGALVRFDEMRLAPGESAEPLHGDELEMVTYVYMGALSHEDSTGGSAVIRAGEFQRRSTGHRVRHKETNVSQSAWAHAFRISLRPEEVGLDAAREEQRFTAAQRRNALCVVGSPDKRKGSLLIHQNAVVYSSILDPGHHVFLELTPGRMAWLHIVCGEATLNDIVLTQGDGVGVTHQPSVSLTVQENTEMLLVELGPAQRAGLKPQIAPTRECQMAGPGAAIGLSSHRPGQT